MRALQGAWDDVPVLLECAEERARAVSATAFSWAMRYHRGRALGGDSGKALSAEATEHFKAAGARNPGRLVNAIAPGFVRRGRG